MSVIKTKRLTIKPLSFDDCTFLIKLLNEEDFHRYIGDKQVYTIEQARNYLIQGPFNMMDEHGFALMKVSLHSGEPIGLCGLLKRDNYPYPDIGYALLKKHYRKGYGFESVAAILQHYQHIRPLLALTSQDNLASKQLLLKAGFSPIDSTERDLSTCVFQLP